MCENELPTSRLSKAIVLAYSLRMYAFSYAMSKLYNRKLSSDRHRPTDRQTIATRGHFRSLDDKDGGHTVRYTRKPHATRIHANLMALSFIESELLTTEVYIAGIGIVDFFAPATLTLTR